MIRDIGNILLIVILLFATTGMVVQKHYMHGELYSASLFSRADSCCTDEKDCSEDCHDESEVLKLENTFRGSGQPQVKANLQPAGIIQPESSRSQAISPAGHVSSKLKLPGPGISPQKKLQVFLL
jgi:hypothetical protein